METEFEKKTKNIKSKQLFFLKKKRRITKKCRTILKKIATKIVDFRLKMRLNLQIILFRQDAKSYSVIFYV